MPLVRFKGKGRDCCGAEHPSHTASLSRMNRALGQLDGAKRMIMDERYCLDILTQLRAVRTAVRAVEAEIFKRHLESCVANSLTKPKEAAAKIAEIKKFMDFMG